MAGTARFASCNDGIGAVTWAAASAVGESAWNGRLPASSSHATIASAYRSLAAPARSPRACSGDRYPAVPRIVPACVNDSMPDAVAIPKSAT